MHAIAKETQMKEKTMNDTLLEQYRRDPVALHLKLEAAARRERALYIHRLLTQAAVALFGTRRSRNSGVERGRISTTH